MNTEQEWPPQIYKPDLSNMKVGDFMFAYNPPEIIVSCCEQQRSGYSSISIRLLMFVPIVLLTFLSLYTHLLIFIKGAFGVLLVYISLGLVSTLQKHSITPKCTINFDKKTISSSEHKLRRYSDLSNIIIFRDYLSALLTTSQYIVGIDYKADTKPSNTFISRHHNFDEAFTMAVALSEAAKVPYVVHKSCKAQYQNIMKNMDE